MEKIMRLILGEVIMSDGQIPSFLQHLFHSEKIWLNWGFDSSVTDYVLLKFIVIPLRLTISLLKYISIRHKIRKKNHTSSPSFVFLLTCNFLFRLSILKNNTKWCIRMVRSSNKSTFLLKNKLHLSFWHNML